MALAQIIIQSNDPFKLRDSFEKVEDPSDFMRNVCEFPSPMSLTVLKEFVSFSSTENILVNDVSTLEDCFLSACERRDEAMIDYILQTWKTPMTRFYNASHMHTADVVKNIVAKFPIRIQSFAWTVIPMHDYQEHFDFSALSALVGNELRDLFISAHTNMRAILRRENKLREKKKREEEERKREKEEEERKREKEEKERKREKEEKERKRENFRKEHGFEIFFFDEEEEECNRRKIVFNGVEYIGKYLDEGSFGAVYRMFHTDETPSKYVIKVIHDPEDGVYFRMQDLCADYGFAPQVHFVYTDLNNMYNRSHCYQFVIMDYIQGLSMDKWIEQCSEIELPFFYNYFSLQLLNMYQVLYENDIWHKDLYEHHFGNMIFSPETGKITLIDFGECSNEMSKRDLDLHKGCHFDKFLCHLDVFKNYIIDELEERKLQKEKEALEEVKKYLDKHKEDFEKVKQDIETRKQTFERRERALEK
jgi:hypothetical protein